MRNVKNAKAFYIQLCVAVKHPEKLMYPTSDPKGVSEMCRIMEDMRNESLKEVALRMLVAGKYVLEEIANITGLSLEEVKKLKAEQMAVENVFTC